MPTEGLFPDACPVDLGPSVHWPDGWPIRRTTVSGAKLSVLRTQVRQMAPGEPGVYAMIDADDQIIYIGKAKDLRKRLFCYFRVKGRDRKARRIVSRARAIVWEALPTEFTALLRELELIRRWRPTWNVQGQPLRRRHAYLCLGHSPAPYLNLSRKAAPKLLASFGPLPVTTTTRSAVRWLNDGFGLRECPPGPVDLFPATNPLFPIAPPSGCLRLELGTCVGPCVPTTTRTAYHDRVRAARAFLEGRDRTLLEAWRTAMTAAALAARYEAAAHWRDKIAAVEWLLARLDGLKHAQQTLTFVYPMPVAGGGEIWYLIHGARVLACVAAPRDPITAQVALEQLSRVYRANDKEPILEAYEPIDGKVLVLSWFRRQPRRRERTLSPKEALTRCRRRLRKSARPEQSG